MTSLSGLGTRKRRQRVAFVPIFSWVLIFLSMGILMLELIRFSQQTERFPADVRIAGVAVGGLTAGEASSRLEQAYSAPVTVWYDESPIQIDPAAIGFRIDRETMLAEARTSTSSEGAFWLQFFNYLTGQEAQTVSDIPLRADYRQSALNSIIDDIAARYDRTPGQADYDLQTLTFRPGNAGFILNRSRALTQIDQALRDPINRSVVLSLNDTDGSRVGIDTLRSMIIDYLDAEGFVYDGQTQIASVFVLDLKTGEEINILSDVAVSAASTIKVAILIDYFRTILFSPTDDEAFLMVQSLLCSNNSSSNLLMQIAGRNDLFNGIRRVIETMQTLGARNTYISAPFYLGIEGQVLGSVPAPTTRPNANFRTNADPFNQTTAEDMGTIFSLIYDCARYGSGLAIVYPEEITQLECQQMLAIMSANDLERLLQGGIPQEATISHKNGWLGDVHGDAGIVFPPNGNDYIIAVFVWEQGEFFTFERAWPLIEDISRAAWNYFSPEAPLLARRTDLPPTAADCVDFSPPYGRVNLNDINAWRSDS